MSHDLLRIEHLKKYFPIKGGFFGRTIGQVYAVDDVSLSIQKGSTLGLVGESGCGKSTLGRTILKLYPSTAGTISFDGKDLTHLSTNDMRPIRRDLQIIFQDPYSSLNPRMLIGTILEEPLIIHKIGTKQERLKRVDELLDIVGLNQEAKFRYPHEFSGGQRQRVGIARALALNPKLIIADEPVSALDVSIQSQILNLLGDLKHQFGLSYLFIAHDLAVVEHISDFVAVMYLGKVVEHTESEKLYLEPKHPYTKALIDAIPKPIFNKDRKKIKDVLTGDVPSPMNPPEGCYFHPRCPFAMERCKKDRPVLKNIGSDKKPHLVSCHLYE